MAIPTLELGIPPGSAPRFLSVQSWPIAGIPVIDSNAKRLSIRITTVEGLISLHLDCMSFPFTRKRAGQSMPLLLAAIRLAEMRFDGPEFFEEQSPEYPHPGKRRSVISVIALQLFQRV
jgi:hypothetical protein